MDIYLRAFCREHSYPAEAEEALLVALAAAEGTPMGDTLTRWVQAYEEAGTATDLGEALGAIRATALPEGVSLYTVELLYFILCSRHLWDLYQQQGIGYEIFFNSMEDLKYKLQECHTVHGVWGSFVAGWFIGFFTMERFALGRLQYEEKVLSTVHPVEAHKGDTYTVDGCVLTPDSRVVNVHIPSAGPLLPEEVAASFRQAAAFYAHRFEGCVPFVCYSWLLYAPNREILPPTSRIRQFMDFFTHAWDKPDEKGEDLWRVFGMDERISLQDMDVAALPRDNSLRRAYQGFLAAGNLPGEALAFHLETIE